jgi:predicted RecA/RadA family phage recombinase
VAVETHLKMSTKMNSQIYKINDRVANASFNALSGCIVCKLGTVIAVDNSMIEIANDGDRRDDGSFALPDSSGDGELDALREV